LTRTEIYRETGETTVSAPEPAGDRRGGRGAGRPRNAGGGGGQGRSRSGGQGRGGAKGKGGQAADAEKGPRKKVDRRIQIGVVVPPEKVLDRAEHTRLLQVDASSEPLTERVVTPWLERTPDNTILDVRAHRLLTQHAAPAEGVWPEVRDLLTPELRSRPALYASDLPDRALDLALDRFLASVAPLREHGRLGALVFPFPSYFTPGQRALDYLEWLRGRSGDVPIAIELRHRDWVAGKQREATLEFLREHQLGYVCVDVPSGFDSSQPPLSVATTDTAFVRFHGRNADAWERDADTGDDRFAYDYRDADFEPWPARLEKLTTAAQSVHVIFSGRNPDAGARSARLLVRVLTGDVVPEKPTAPRPERRGGRGGRGGFGGGAGSGGYGGRGR
jgi:uncharacterized protein YecE (DUF72 family)